MHNSYYMVETLVIRNTNQPSLFQDGRLVVWFSRGAASACALKLVAHMKPLAIYCDTSADENEDGARFQADVERWTGVQIQSIRSAEFKSIEDVFEARQYMSGVNGAVCTTEMKKVPRFQFQRADDIHIFGYTIDEADRLAKFEADNFDMSLAWPLIQAGFSKEDCFGLIRDAGITLPLMYLLGFKNNNCIGCVKSKGVKYWNKVRKHFPAVFKRRAEQSRRIGCRLVEFHGVRIFLDELPPDADDNIVEDLSCGPHCGSVLALAAETGITR